MGKMSRKTEKNLIRTEDKKRKEKGEVPKGEKALTNRMINSARRMDKQAQKEINKQAKFIAEIANSCVLCYSMSVIWNKWKFSAERLREFYKKWIDTHDAITFENGVPVEDLLNTVRGGDYECGDIGFKKYEIRRFDTEKDEFDKMPGNSSFEKLMNYYARKKMVGCMNFAEVVTMLVLFDYFGFKATKLAHYIQHVRKFYDLSFSASKKMALQMEDKCKIEFDIFAKLKSTRENGGIRIYEEGRLKAC